MISRSFFADSIFIKRGVIVSYQSKSTTPASSVAPPKLEQHCTIENSVTREEGEMMALIRQTLWSITELVLNEIIASSNALTVVLCSFLSLTYQI